MKYLANPWQKLMTNFLIDHKRCNLWCPMGGGKTSSVFTAFDILMMAGSNFFPALVLAPLRVARDVWPAERNKWDHLDGMRVQPIIGSAEDRRRALGREADVYCVNYENIPWLVDYLGDRWPFKTVVADESTKLKSHRLKQGKVRTKKLAEVARKTGRWINLTGTPAPNGYKDLWGQTWFLDYGERLGGSYSDYVDNYFISDPYTREVAPRKGAEEEIQKKLADITLTIRMEDWVDVRKPITNIVTVTLPADRMKEYRKLEREMFVELASGIELTALSAAAKTTKCLQYAAGAVYHDDDRWTNVHNVKLDALEDIVEETAGANLLVAYWWRHDAERILHHFPHARMLKTKSDMDDWNAGRIEMGLLHPQSGGHGLNLQSGGHHLVHFSLWWNLEAFQQINERIGPMRQLQSGFNRAVYYHHIVVKGTLDEDVRDRLESKRSVQEILLNSMKRREL